MMQNVHLAPEMDEDDLYSGYNDYNPTYDAEVNKSSYILCSTRWSSWLVKSVGLRVLLHHALSKLIKSLEKCITEDY